MLQKAGADSIGIRQQIAIEEHKEAIRVQAEQAKKNKEDLAKQIHDFVVAKNAKVENFKQMLIDEIIGDVQQQRRQVEAKQLMLEMQNKKRKEIEEFYRNEWRKAKIPKIDDGKDKKIELGPFSKRRDMQDP